ncbi:unnamed protein product [Boreogadus saida]
MYGLPILAAVGCSLLLLTLFPVGSESASCCLRYRQLRLKCKDTHHYSLQNINGSCDMRAVIFHVGQNFVCADPNRRRTKRLMACLDNKGRTRNRRHS